MNPGIGTCLLMWLLALAYATGCLDTPLNSAGKLIAAAWSRATSQRAAAGRDSSPGTVSGSPFYMDTLEMDFPIRASAYAAAEQCNQTGKRNA